MRTPGLSTALEGPAPSGPAEALALVQAGLAFLAEVDPAGLTGVEQAELLRGLATAESVHLAVSARLLAAFDVGGGYTGDGQLSARAWLRWQTRISSAAAGAATAWQRRLAAHPPVAAALAAGRVSPSYAREICDWTRPLEGEQQPAADQVLLDAAAGGADLADLGRLAEEIRRRCARPDSGDIDDSFAQRRLRLTPHFQGNARLDADLTPQAAAALRAVLDSLGRKTGPEDERTQPQRDHDALEEACRQLVAAGQLPARAGQPAHIQLHMTLAELLRMPGAEHTHAAWSAANEAPAPPGAECDAAITPVVTGDLDRELLDRLISEPSVTGPMAERAAAQLTIRDAVRLLSGPAGLAAWLRAALTTGPAATPSLPLDIGRATDTIPPHLRRAITRRDEHCRFPGCQRRAAACHVHHLVPRADGGPTSLENCCLLCTFHHLIAVHRWGWQLILNPDGTTIATSPDRSKTLHSHAPPTAA